jgi:hypothetical protein
VAVVGSALAFPTGEAVIVLATYVGGVVLLMVGLTVATGMGVLAGAGRLSAYTHLLERVAGVVMILAGLWQLYLSVVVLNVGSLGDRTGLALIGLVVAFLLALPVASRLADRRSSVE